MTFHLFPSNLRAARNMLVQLYMDLANFLLFQNNPSCSKHAKAAVQGPGDLPLVPKQPQSWSNQLFRYLVTFPLLPSNLSAVLNMLEQLYRDLTTFHLFSSNLRVVLNMLEQLYRHLATFHLFPSNLRAVLNMLQKLYRDLTTFPLAPKQPPSCSEHAAAAGTWRPSSCSQGSSEFFWTCWSSCTGTWRSSTCSQATSELF